MISSLVRRQSRRRGNNHRKQQKRRIADQHIRKLMSFAISEAKTNPNLAQRYATIAWKMSTKFNVRMGERRRYFCHHCKKFIVPPTTARIRLSKKRRGLNLTCLLCGITYRKLF